MHRPIGYMYVFLPGRFKFLVLRLIIMSIIYSVWEKFFFHSVRFIWYYSSPTELFGSFSAEVGVC